MKLFRCIVGTVIAFQVTVGTVTSAYAQSPDPAARGVYFPQTGHLLDNTFGFLDYWRAHGQVLRFGYPITEVMTENDRPVQYFERARMEYHAEYAGTASSVLLGLLGSEVTAGRQFKIGPVVAGRLFPQTGYTVFGKFLQYWNTWGGLEVFGYPISESYTELLPNGRTLAVQWFERARIEYHPENVPAFYAEREVANNTHNLLLYEMQMGLLGSEVAQAHGASSAAVPRPGGVPDWSPALWSQRIDVDLTKQQLTAFEGDLLVFSSGVSTGRDSFETPTGTFYVYAKLLYDDMSGTLQGQEYDVRKVPFVQYFTQGYALHGTYWHEQFGTGVRMSHGCVNLPMDRAEWLWDWAQPRWSIDRAQHAVGYTPEQPKTAAEAELQPLEGLAIFQRGTTVVVHK